MKLYFENSYGESRVIAEVKTLEEISQEIKKFIDNCNKNKPKEKQFK